MAKITEGECGTLAEVPEGATIERVNGRDCLGMCVRSEQGGYRCSEFGAMFGCHNYLPDGWSLEEHPKPVRIPYICID